MTRTTGYDLDKKNCALSFRVRCCCGLPWIPLYKRVLHQATRKTYIEPPKGQNVMFSHLLLVKSADLLDAAESVSSWAATRTPRRDSRGHATLTSYSNPLPIKHLHQFEIAGLWGELVGQ